jgi:hypothetical protein
VHEDTRIISAGGNVRVTGTAGGSAASAYNIGVHVDGAGQITAHGTGTVTVQGEGGAATGNHNAGIVLAGEGAVIFSGRGDVSVSGRGGGITPSTKNYGVMLYSGGLITAGSSGKVLVEGKVGASAEEDNWDVFIAPPRSAITSAEGALKIIGSQGSSSILAPDPLLMTAVTKPNSRDDGRSASPSGRPKEKPRS